MHPFLSGRRNTPNSAPLASPRPTEAEGKVRVALAALDQAAQSAANRSVGMDTKASILLVIAGIITTSSLKGDGLLYRASAVVALLAGVAALVSLWPRTIKGVHPKTVTDKLTSNSDTLPQFEYWLLAMHNSAAVLREQHLRKRGHWLTAGFVLAVAAMALAALSLIQDGNWFAAWLSSYRGMDAKPIISPTPH